MINVGPQVNLKAEHNPDGGDNRSVRVFVSSTFLDMQAERDVLVKETFPALRAKFRTRGVEILEIDLRWGVREEDVESGKTAPICLSEIDRCQPYFVGLLGERYGSTLSVDSLSEDAIALFPTLADAAGRSLTEIEIIHGVLGDHERASRALFFERDPAWLATLTGERHAQYTAESDETRAKLANLN